MRNSLITLAIIIIIVIGAALFFNAKENGSAFNLSFLNQNPQTSTMTTLDALKQMGDYTKFVKIIEADGATNDFTQAGPITVFAPTDEAFKDVTQDEMDKFLSDKKAMNSFLANHMVSGNLTVEEIGKTSTLETVSKNKIQVKNDNGKITVGNSANIAKQNIPTKNGMIQAIDQVNIAEQQQSPELQQQLQQLFQQRLGGGQGQQQQQLQQQP